jgi:hypothetical protein
MNNSNTANNGNHSHVPSQVSITNQIGLNSLHPPRQSTQNSRLSNAGRLITVVPVTPTISFSKKD